MKKGAAVKIADEICLVIFLNEMYESNRVPDAIRDLWTLEEVRMVHMETITPTQFLMEEFCHKDDNWLIEAGKKTINLLRSGEESTEKDALEYGYSILKSTIDYYSEGTILALVLSGPNACTQVLELVGDEKPDHAKPGTMRAKYANDYGWKASKEARVIKNRIYCSENHSDSLSKIKILLPKFNPYILT